MHIRHLCLSLSVSLYFPSVLHLRCILEVNVRLGNGKFTIRFSRETSRTLLGVSAVFLAFTISCLLEYCR